MRLFRRREPQPPAPTHDRGSEEAVLEEAQRLVHPGFTSLDEAREAIVELVEDDEELGVTPARAEAIVEEVWRRRSAEQQAWHDLSDADRVEAAFTELEAQGIVARMCFTCCQTCGVSEIGDEVPPGADARGFVFFHQQDADRLADPGAPLFLTYGAFVGGEGHERASVAVGHDIRRSLEANGLDVDWDGSIRSRICVRNLDWRRRLPA